MITRSFNLQQHLQHLDLSNTGLDDVTIAFIMQGPWPCLKRLALADNSLTDCGLETMKGVALSTLQDLDVSGNKFHAAGIARLVQSSGTQAGNMTPTARLFCYFPKAFSDRFGLTGSPKTFELTKLHLGGLHLDANAISVLVKCLWRLQVLDLSYNWLGCAAMAVFATGPWYSLTTLDLSHNRLDVRAVAELVKLDMPSLRDLNLYRNDLRVGAVAVLVEAEWPVLQCLQLEGQRLAGADLLAYTNALTAVVQKWPALATKQASPH